MSIELFAGKLNIFESNWLSGKILSEIHRSHALRDVRLGCTTPDENFLRVDAASAF